MSTDWDVVCEQCRVYAHLGQRFSSGCCFGYGSKDEDGRKFAADFINDHIDHGLRIMTESPVDYEWIDD